MVSHSHRQRRGSIGWRYPLAEDKVSGTGRQRKGFVDFQALLQQELIPQARRRQVQTGTLILDHGTTHAPKQLDSWLREQPAACGGRLHFQVRWLPPNASWVDQIAIWFRLLQRTHLQPHHLPSTEALETSLNAYLAFSTHTAKPINLTYPVAKLEQKLGTPL